MINKINRYFNFESNQYEEEEIYAGDLMDKLYSTPRGKLINFLLYSRKYFNWYFGFYKNSRFSLPQVEIDIKKFNIPMSDFESSHYKTYTDFFLRKFRPGVRPFSTNHRSFCAIAEGNYFAFDKISPDLLYPVKSEGLDINTILNGKYQDLFKDGQMLICRLCPVDYHRFHYPDDGTTIETYNVPGGYHSVTPLALKNKSDIFCSNYRQVTFLSTQNFGKIAYVEVGAMVVGKIVQTHPTPHFKKGDLKGHFEYGASTIILIFEKNCIQWDSKLIENSLNGIECKIKLGTSIGEKN